jgi:beta-lactamase class A
MRRPLPGALSAALVALFVLISLSASGCAGSAPAGPRAPWEGPLTPQAQAVEKAVDRAYRHTAKVTVAVAYLDLTSGAQVLRNENRPFHAASTMKVPVMIAAWDAVDQGAMTIDQPVAVRNEFRSIVDGSRYHLAPADDADPQLYAAVGTTLPLSELIRHMIVRSSNLATNLLVDQLGAARVVDAMRRLGAYSTQVLRGVEDEKAYQAGLNNEVTALDLMVMLAAIARTAGNPAAAPAAPPDPGANEALAAPLLSHRAATAMLAVLAAQEFNEKIPAGLPAGVPVAHKTGDIVGFHHDAAIVSPPGEQPYVLVVLTGGFADEAAADRFIAGLSRGIWEARHLPPPPPPAATPRRHRPGGDSGRE